MILFIDTAFKETRIAIKKNDIFFQVVINEKINISKVINKELKKLLERSHSCQKDISLICFNSGPGNFTSLRVTLSCVKALGFYLNIPVVKLNSFQILALSNKDLIKKLPLVIAIDAKMNEIFWQLYSNYDDIFLGKISYGLSKKDIFYSSLSDYQLNEHYFIKNDENFLDDYTTNFPKSKEIFVSTETMKIQNILKLVESSGKKIQEEVDNVNLLYIRDNVALKN